MSIIKSSGKIYNIGHRDISDLLNNDDIVIVQEKYDGSQFSFKWDEAGALHARSKGKVQYDDGCNLDLVDKLFLPAVLHLMDVDPQSPNRVFRAETIATPKHNTLLYERVPDGFLVLFGVELLNEFGEVEDYEDLYSMGWGTILGVDVAQQITALLGSNVTMERLDQWLKQESSLGGTLVEGVVVKNFDRFSPRDGNPLMGKHVSEKFKETHKRSWKGSHPSVEDVVQQILEALNTEARFEKAVQHLRDDGVLVGEPKDIGPLMIEVKKDVLAEELDYMTTLVMAQVLPRIQKGLGRGLPEWYKLKLAEKAINFSEVTGA